MFSLEEIKNAHSKVKSGADFPIYIQDLKKLGITQYSTFVSDGHTEFLGQNNYHITSEGNYKTLDIHEVANSQQFKDALKAHQEGKTDYPTFCKDCAHAGIKKWTVSILQRTCIYFDKSENKVLLENIPQ